MIPHDYMVSPSDTKSVSSLMGTISHHSCPAAHRYQVGDRSHPANWDGMTSNVTSPKREGPSKGAGVLSLLPNTALPDQSSCHPRNMHAPEVSTCRASCPRRPGNANSTNPLKG